MERTYTHNEISDLFTWDTTLKTWQRIWVSAAVHTPEVPPHVAEQLGGLDLPAIYPTAAEIEPHEIRAAILAFDTHLPPSASRWIHWGMTSSDITDTALSLQCRAAHGIIDLGLEMLTRSILDLRGAGNRIARTHGRIADIVPIRHTLDTWAENIYLAQQMLGVGGWYGKMSGPLGDNVIIDEATEQQILRDLNLEPAYTGQAIPRFVYAHRAAQLATTAAALQTIIGEIRFQMIEGIDQIEWVPNRQVGSSSMPHKNNPTRLERLYGLCNEVIQAPPLLWTGSAHLGDRDMAHSSVERNTLPRIYTRLGYIITELIAVFDQIEFKKLDRSFEPGTFERLHQMLADTTLSRVQAERHIRDGTHNKEGKTNG